MNKFMSIWKNLKGWTGTLLTMIGIMIFFATPYSDSWMPFLFVVAAIIVYVGYDFVALYLFFRERKKLVEEDIK